MGIREVWAAIRGKKVEQKDEDIEKRISKLGIDVVNDRKLSDRIDLIQAMHNTIEEPITETEPELRLATNRKRLLEINRALKVSAVPYGRAGEQDRYREAMHGWEILYSLSTDIMNTVESMLEDAKKESNQPLEKSDPKLISVLGKDTYEKLQEWKKSTLHKFSAVNMQEVERKFESFLMVEVYPYALYIMDASYWDKDVAPNYTTVIQQWPASQKGIDINAAITSLKHDTNEAKQSDSSS